MSNNDKKNIEKNWTIETQLTFFMESMLHSPLVLIFGLGYFNSTSLVLVLIGSKLTKPFKYFQLILHISTWSLYKHFASIAAMFAVDRS